MLKKQRVYYWSGSRLANFIRKMVDIKRPIVETLDGWAEWRNNYKSKHPAFYFLSEELLNKLQNAYMFIPDLVHHIQHSIFVRFFKNRTIVYTRLNDNLYHEYEEVLLHAMFESFTLYVDTEVVQDSITLVTDFKLPKWYKNNGFIYRCLREKYRNKDLSIEVIDKNIDYYREKDSQRDRTELEKWTLISELYKWWTIDRPNREDPFVKSGYNDIIDGAVDTASLMLRYKLPEAKEASQRMQEIEDEYDLEDGEMMLRLIKIRKLLWT